MFFLIFSESVFTIISVTYLDSSKVNTMLNWKPQFDLDTGIQKTIQWYKIFLEDSKID